MRVKVDIPVGTVFGRLVVVGEADTDVKPNRKLKCRCLCGTERDFTVGHLRHGSSKSCGCASKELASRRLRTHGKSNSTEYSAWLSMFARCYNEDYAHYDRYGGRQITVCERWSSFETFFADMGAKPSKEHSLDRVNGDSNYEPSNCRWATKSEQAVNRKSSVYLLYAGELKHVSEVSALTGIKASTLRARINRNYPESSWLTPVVVGRRPSFGNKPKKVIA